MWVARDKDGSLCLYLHKPFRNDRDDNWWDVDAVYDTENPCMYYKDLPTDLYPDLKWEDEPIEVTQ